MSNKKHMPPLRCHIRRALFGVSPSALCARCGLGVKHKSKKCKGCTKNVDERILEAFQEGIREGAKAPSIQMQISTIVDLMQAAEERAYESLQNREE